MAIRPRPLLRNADGQPLAGFRDRENILKTVEHLLGLCRGLLADGQLNVQEVTFLATWMENHLDELREHPVGRLLIARVVRVIQDNVITEEELLDLKSGLEEVLGGGVFDDAGAGGLACTAKADTGVAIAFSGRAFVVTGKFLYGPPTGSRGSHPGPRRAAAGQRVQEGALRGDRHHGVPRLDQQQLRHQAREGLRAQGRGARRAHHRGAGLGGGALIALADLSSGTVSGTARGLQRVAGTTCGAERDATKFVGRSKAVSPSGTALSL